MSIETALLEWIWLRKESASFSRFGAASGRVVEARFPTKGEESRRLGASLGGEGCGSS